jgi:hypothetical protein
MIYDDLNEPLTTALMLITPPTFDQSLMLSKLQLLERISKRFDGNKRTGGTTDGLERACRKRRVGRADGGAAGGART